MVSAAKLANMTTSALGYGRNHAIDATISQNHAARFEDIDGDGLPDLITGKRWLAHFTSDIGVSNKKGLHYFEQE